MSTSLLDRIAIYVLMATCFVSIGFISGWRVEKWRYDSKELKNTQIAIQVLRENVDISIKRTQDLILEQQKIVVERNQKIAEMQKKLGDLNDFVKTLPPIKLFLDIQHQQLLKHISEEANRPVREGD